MTLPILLIAAAAAIFFGVDLAMLKQAWATVSAAVDAKKAAAVGLVVLALLLLPRGASEDTPAPSPDAGPLSLRGQFVGPTASEDAGVVGAFCSELADEIAYDGDRPEGERYLKTGVAVDELRRATRTLRCRGISIGDRQPKARDVIAAYLDAKVGTDGGPLSGEQRAAWVTAYRDIGRAASDAAK
jgi:hypothetical protein